MPGKTGLQLLMHALSAYACPAQRPLYDGMAAESAYEEPSGVRQTHGPAPRGVVHERRRTTLTEVMEATGHVSSRNRACVPRRPLVDLRRHVAFSRPLVPEHSTSFSKYRMSVWSDVGQIRQQFQPLCGRRHPRLRPADPEGAQPRSPTSDHPSPRVPNGQEEIVLLPNTAGAGPRKCVVRAAPCRSRGRRGPRLQAFCGLTSLLEAAPFAWCIYSYV